MEKQKMTETLLALGGPYLMFEISECGKTAAELRNQYDKVLSWADLFSGSSMEGKKMIVWQLIEQVRIFRNYRIEIDLKVGFEQFKTLWSRTETKVSVDIVA